jgi:hypothetical protein
MPTGSSPGRRSKQPSGSSPRVARHSAVRMCSPAAPADGIHRWEPRPEKLQHRSMLLKELVNSGTASWPSPIADPGRHLTSRRPSSAGDAERRLHHSSPLPITRVQQQQPDRHLSVARRCVPHAAAYSGGLTARSLARGSIHGQASHGCHVRPQSAQPIPPARPALVRPSAGAQILKHTASPTQHQGRHRSTLRPQGDALGGSAPPTLWASVEQQDMSRMSSPLAVSLSASIQVRSGHAAAAKFLVPICCRPRSRRYALLSHVRHINVALWDSRLFQIALPCCMTAVCAERLRQFVTRALLNAGTAGRCTLAQLAPRDQQSGARMLPQLPRPPVHRDWT